MARLKEADKCSVGSIEPIRRVWLLLLPTSTDPDGPLSVREGTMTWLPVRTRAR